MNIMLTEYLSKKEFENKNFSNEEKNKILIQEGLYTKEYSDTYSSEYCFSEDGKYYKRVPIEVSDEEFAEVMKYVDAEENNTRSNSIANALIVIAILIFTGGFILGIAMGNIEVAGYYTSRTEYHFEISLIYWAVSLVSGMIFLAIAEIIKLLTEIKNKIN